MESKSIQVELHSIIMLIGPSNCGKSYFARNILIPQLKRATNPVKPINIQYISSDEIRKQLLGHDYSKYDKEMMHASEQAFNMLYAQVDNATQYPINSEVVIVDTLGLFEGFRERILEIAKRNNYAVHAIIFDYKERDDYLKHIPDDQYYGYARKYVSKSIDRLKREVLPEISKRDFDRIDRIRSSDFTGYGVALQDFDRYLSCFLPADKRYVVIGDVHGCYEEFLSLLEKNGAKIEKGKLETDAVFILVGDLIDKGYASKEVLAFILENIESFKIVLGNHDNFVYKYLNGLLAKNIVPNDLKEGYFTSIPEFADDVKAKEDLARIIELSRPFYWHRDFIVTHAPAHKQYLGKLDKSSLRNQRTFIYSKRKDYDSDEAYKTAVENDLGFLKVESGFHLPYHVFGHIAFESVLQVKNKIDIDTGCSNRNALTSFEIKQGRPFFESVSSKSNTRLQDEKLMRIFTKQEIAPDVKDLSKSDLSRIRTLAEARVNYVSGTMTPADKALKQNILESLQQALYYYKNKSVHEVILEPKYMGSRCNVYFSICGPSR